MGRWWGIALILGVLLPAAVSAQDAYFGKNKVQYKKFDWSFIQTDHFDIYFAQDGQNIAEFTAVAAESAYTSISKALPLPARQPRPHRRLQLAQRLPADERHRRIPRGRDRRRHRAVQEPGRHPVRGGLQEIPPRDPPRARARGYQRHVLRRIDPVDHLQQHHAPAPALVQRGAGRVRRAEMGHELRHVPARRDRQPVPPRDQPACTGTSPTAGASRSSGTSRRKYGEQKIGEHPEPDQERRGASRQGSVRRSGSASRSCPSDGRRR